MFYLNFKGTLMDGGSLYHNAVCYDGLAVCCRTGTRGGSSSANFLTLGWGLVPISFHCPGVHFSRAKLRIVCKVAIACRDYLYTKL